MLSITDVTKKLGSRVLYIGTETAAWQVQDLVKAARNAKTMGFDTICPKRADGTNKWYLTKQHLALEKQAVNSEGVGYVPFVYSYAPVYHDVSLEIAVWQEIASVCDGLVMVDMEVEWNGKVDDARTLASALHGFAGDVIVTTWADPNLQEWQALLPILDPVVSAWSPQQYTDWLAGQEASEWSKLEQGKILPSIDLTGEYGNATHPIAITQQAVKNGHRSAFYWEYQAAVANPNAVKAILSAFGGNFENTQPIVLPHNPSPAKKQQYGSYVIQSGDTLSGIAAHLHMDWVALYNLNKITIEQTAKAHGMASSNEGSLIFPGTSLTYPLS